MQAPVCPCPRHTCVSWIMSRPQMLAQSVLVLTSMFNSCNTFSSCEPAIFKSIWMVKNLDYLFYSYYPSRKKLVEIYSWGFTVAGVLHSIYVAKNESSKALELSMLVNCLSRSCLHFTIGSWLEIYYNNLHESLSHFYRWLHSTCHLVTSSGFVNSNLLLIQTDCIVQ